MTEKREDRKAQGNRPAAGRPPAGDPPADYAINAQAHQILHRHWVDTERLEVGTTGGVILVRGRIERTPHGRPAAWRGDGRAQLLWGLRSALRAIPGVIDVVIEDESMKGERAR